MEGYEDLHLSVLITPNPFLPHRRKLLLRIPRDTALCRAAFTPSPKSTAQECLVALGKLLPSPTLSFRFFICKMGEMTVPASFQDQKKQHKQNTAEDTVNKQ